MQIVGLSTLRYRIIQCEMNFEEPNSSTYEVEEFSEKTEFAKDSLKNRIKLYIILFFRKLLMASNYKLFI